MGERTAPDPAHRTAPTVPGEASARAFQTTLHGDRRTNFPAAVRSAQPHTPGRIEDPAPAPTLSEQTAALHLAQDAARPIGWPDLSRAAGAGAPKGKVSRRATWPGRT